MAVLNPQKTVSPEKIQRNGITRLKISFEAGGDLSLHTTDLILAVDCSGSMGGAPLEKTVEAAENMVDILRKASCAGEDGRFHSCPCREKQFCTGCRMGLIGFSDRAREEVPLGDSGDAVIRGLQGLRAGGNTNHEGAFLLAGKMLEGSKAERKILILFTDGKSNQGCPDGAAQELQCRGVEIYCLGLGMEIQAFQNWASCPWEQHAKVTDCLCRLHGLFAWAAGEIIGSYVLAPEILERVREGFEIRRILPPSRGKAVQLDSRTVRWTMEGAGTEGPETLSLCLDVAYTGTETGVMPINACISYRDACRNCLIFPNPQIEICSCPHWDGDSCPEPVDIPGEPCRDTVDGESVETGLTALGRVVRVNAVIKNVCPGKRLGVAVLLTEVDRAGREHRRGIKFYEIPGQKGEGCRDVQLNCIQFVVPESHCMEDGAGLCRERNFRARVLANYLDTDFTCCDGEPFL